MTWPVELMPEAEAELEASVNWYEKERAGLGDQFLLAFEAAVDSVRRHPESRAVVALATRRALLRRFPYFIFYVFHDGEVLVTALFHARRNPREWANRVREGKTEELAYGLP